MRQIPQPPPDLLGEAPYPLPPSRGYAQPPGTGPAGETCGGCAFFRGGGRYRKCGIGEHSNGPGTDILASAPACRVWTRPGDTLCQRCVHYCPWNGQGWGCSAREVYGLLVPGASPPCFGKAFIQRQPAPAFLCGAATGGET